MDQVAPRVGVSAVAVYHFLCRHSRDERVTGVRVAEIARQLKCGRTALFAALSKLEKHKVIKRVSKPGSESEYEMLDLRRPANQSVWRTGDGRPTKRGYSCGEQPIRKARLRDCKTPIPPTPLSKGGDSRAPSEKGSEDRAQEFKYQLKRCLQDGPLNSPQLAHDDYERYFRDLGIKEPGEGPILVETDNLTLTAEGLRKYARRLKKLGRQCFGREVEFKTVERTKPKGIAGPSPSGAPASNARAAVLP